MHVQPFFLVAAHRSGTTLLRLLLGHHPKIARCDEMEFVVPGLNKSIESYKRWLKTERNYLASGYEVDWSKPFLEIAHGFLQQRQKLDGCEIVGATVHNQFHRLVEIWPDALFIGLHRDPRDVALSSVQMGWHGTAWSGANEWIKAQYCFEELKRRVSSKRLFE